MSFFENLGQLRHDLATCLSVRFAKFGNKFIRNISSDFPCYEKLMRAGINRNMIYTLFIIRFIHLSEIRVVIVLQYILNFELK